MTISILGARLDIDDNEDDSDLVNVTLAFSIKNDWPDPVRGWVEIDLVGVEGPVASPISIRLRPLAGRLPHSFHDALAAALRRAFMPARTSLPGPFDMQVDNWMRMRVWVDQLRHLQFTTTMSREELAEDSDGLSEIAAWIKTELTAVGVPTPASALDLDAGPSEDLHIPSIPPPTFSAAGFSNTKNVVT